jgi:carboxypeptidase family protein
MHRMRAFSTFVATGVFLSLLNSAALATTCFAPPPFKPIRRICGVVFFRSGDKISNAQVLVLQGDKEIAAQQTNPDGKFLFEGLKAGNYEIRVRVEGFGDAYSKIVLAHPEKKTNRELAVNISPSGSCSSISLVKSK